MNDILHSVDIRRNIFNFKTNDKKQILQRRVNINKRNLKLEFKYIYNTFEPTYYNSTRYHSLLFNTFHQGKSLLQFTVKEFNRENKITNRILKENLRRTMIRLFYRNENKRAEDKERLEKAIYILCKYCNNPKKNFTCTVRKAYYDALDYDVDDVYDDSKYYTGSIFKKIRIKKADRKEIIKDELYRYFTKGFITKCCDDW